MDNDVPTEERSSLQLPMSLKKQLRVFIVELIPNILISDGHNFLEAVFTKESINDFRKNFSHVKFSSLRDKVIIVSKWTLQIETVDSKQVYNSFNNFSIKVVVEQFKPVMHETLNSRITHGAVSIFRDNDIQTLIKSYRHWFSQTYAGKGVCNQVEEMKMPSFNDIFAKSEEINFGATIAKT